MRPTHKNLLVKMRQMLVENLRVEDIIQDMVATNIFSKDNAEKVMAKETENDQAFEFLRILPKCGPRAFETFVEVLRKHNKIELADKLADKATAYSSKNQLASFYIKYMSQIQRLPWDPDDTMHLDDVYVNLQWVQEERKPAGTSSDPIRSYTSILHTKQGKRPKRILVRGKAGIGKTTFTQKMATDWANATLGLGECDEVLLRYKHVLIINLRSVQPGQTLKEAMETQITCSAENRKAVTDEVMQALDYDSEHVLLVFDGYDEYDINTSTEITDIIYRRQYQDVCTVITTRPWKAEELMNRRMMDDAYEITGLTEDNIAEYVAKFFNDKQKYDDYLALRSESYLKSLDVLRSIGKGLVGYLEEKKLMSLVRIPILLLFVCLMWQEDQQSDAKTDSLPASYTLLYKKLIQLLLRRRYGIRTQVEMEQSACVKNLEEQTFISLGKLAYDGLVKPDGCLIFDEKDLQKIPDVNELYSLGLLSKCKVHSNLDVKHEVTFPHKTIQEFFAAKYLARKLDENDSNILDKLLENLDTTDKLFDMSFVLRFLFGLSKRATTKVLHRAKSLLVSIEPFRTKYFHSLGLFSVDHVYSSYSQWFNDLLLENWYAHCPQKTVLPPELISCHKVLCIPESFQHSDPGFQQVLNDSVDSLLSSPQIYSGMLKGLIAVSLDNDMLVTEIPDYIHTGRQEIEHKLLSLLRKCDMFEELVAVFWKSLSHTCDDCTYTLNHVISKAPNLQTLVITTNYSGALSSIPNPGKLLHLDVRDINVQDWQVILQMGHLECINVSCGLSRDPPPQLGLIPITSHDLTRIDIRFTPLRAVGVQLLGRNLHHVPGLERLGLVCVFMGGPKCGPGRCTCPRGEDTTYYERCQDVCKAVRELSQGVIHTTKLKDFSFSVNDLGQYHGITSPLIALVQSLSTVSQQTGMEIDMSWNDLGRVDRLSELIEAIVRSYQHESSWYLRLNNLEKSLPKPDDSLNCQVSHDIF
ncbi:NACHT, LRR and PYD domains-containing protein 3-like [Lingula anatina]|uniref:NACHT, LRR and PYD domains-containing protein 3-like n=1 Tax=Lingula anatina TaxID=7574 RepID=A0A1S3I4U0_LINAN|nr:NACHT, LRR and PYD domains-containing protein 3-like [Lingula anatina]|eukprot:XP_013392384.1 NACHT, LRR and PYD domains-containing protein 3-like [Lingula anatina]